MAPRLTERKLELNRGEIHLWFSRAQCIRDTDLIARYPQLLTPEETAKQQRYLFAQDRHAALVTRAFLRDLLSHYAPVRPADWRFTIGDKGKPEIMDPPLPLRFNLSHARDMIICAVTLHDDIGCDVESLERRADPLRIASHYFSEREVNELFSLPGERQRSRFFDYWTLKESYIKACGTGLFGVPLGDFSFAIGGGDGSRVNDDIRIAFAPSITDDSALWRSWLYYPSERNRIAISVKAASAADASGAGRRFRLFASTPLAAVQELDWGCALAEPQS